MKCPKCGKQGLRKRVMLYVTCPAEQYSLDKTAIRKKEVQIHYADWENDRLMCPACKWME